jgi:AP-2 complex subunit alpha
MVASVLQTYSLIYHLLVLLLMVSDSLLVELSCSIRRRALDLLYGMCDVSNAKDIVEELLQYLSTAEFSMREELSLKAAILAEKFAPDLSWYVDVILQLIDKAGDFVSDDIWFRVVQFVTNNEDLQPYAASKAREYLDKIAIHETMVKVVHSRFP